MIILGIEKCANRPKFLLKEISEGESLTVAIFGYKYAWLDKKKLYWVSFTLPLIIINPYIKIKLTYHI